MPVAIRLIRSASGLGQPAESPAGSSRLEAKPLLPLCRRSLCPASSARASTLARSTVRISSFPPDLIHLQYFSLPP